MKIGLVGAPGAGKTVLGASLHKELLLLGVPSFLVSEYAREFYARNNACFTVEDQEEIFEEQSQREYGLRGINGVVICDAVTWNTKVYLERYFTTDDPLYDYLFNKASVAKSSKGYDLTVFVPLFDERSRLETGRVHNYEESSILEGMFIKELESESEVIRASTNLIEREAFVKRLALKIKERFEQQ